MANTLALAQQLAGQTLKAGLYATLQRITRRETLRIDPDATRTQSKGPTPGRDEFLGDVRRLIRSDAEAAAEGIYPPSSVLDGSLVRQFRRVREMLRDVPNAVARRHGDARTSAREVTAQTNLPDYFVQDFHYQDGGYLSERSARLYDVQVETLFGGVAGAMRRQALRPIVEHLRGRDQRQASLADVACGTGRFLGDVLAALPALQMTGIDLSSPYIDEAKRHLGARRNLRLVVANAEDIPLPTASQDVVTTVFLFHELPRDVRRTVIGEMARVLKPDGLFVFIDSLQTGDRPGWDGILDAFPERFHEPYYRDYIADDLDGAFAQAGLAAEAWWPAFMSKVVVRRKV